MEARTSVTALVGIVVLATFFAGCGDARPGSTISTPSAEVLVEKPPAKEDDTSDALSGTRVHDFGTILAQDQEVSHNFVFHNKTDSTIYIRGAESLMPCCASIGPLPEQIGPSEGAQVPIRFRVGRRSGEKVIGFEVFTEGQKRIAIQLAIRANLVSSFEVTPINQSSARVLVGQESEQLLTITSRRIGSEGSWTPEVVLAPRPLTARFDGVAEAHSLSDGLLETKRKVRIYIPGTATPGRKLAELRFTSPHGECGTHVVSWEVIPRIEAIPAGWTVRASKGTARQRIILRSSERPFRILGCSGPLLSGDIKLPQEAAKTQVVEVGVDPTLDRGLGASDISFKTDDPHQSVVVISVAVIPG